MTVPDIWIQTSVLGDLVHQLRVIPRLPIQTGHATELRNQEDGVRAVLGHGNKQWLTVVLDFDGVRLAVILLERETEIRNNAFWSSSPIYLLYPVDPIVTVTSHN